jgi:hypothetical protein
MTNAANFKQVTDALAACIAAAPEAERAALAEAMEGWATTYHRSYANLGRIPVAARMFDTMGEASDARL